MGTASSGRTRSSAGSRDSADVSLFSAHTGALEESLLQCEPGTCV